MSGPEDDSSDFPLSFFPFAVTLHCYPLLPITIPYCGPNEP